MPPKKSSASKDGGPKKKSSAYQIYMKGALAKLKETDPDIPHKERFAKAAKAWKNHADNPKRE